MITDQDIVRLAKVFVTKEDLVPIKEGISEINTNIAKMKIQIVDLQQSVDLISRNVARIDLETRQIKRHLRLP